MMCCSITPMLRSSGQRRSCLDLARSLQFSLLVVADPVYSMVRAGCPRFRSQDRYYGGYQKTSRLQCIVCGRSGILYKNAEVPSQTQTRRNRLEAGDDGVRVGQNHTLLFTHILKKLLLCHSDSCMEMICEIVAGLGGRVLLGPLAAHALRVLLVLLVVLRDICRERVVGVRRGEESLDREQDGADLESGRPLV